MKTKLHQTNLAKVPRHQRDAIALSNILSVPIESIASLVKTDVSNEGITINKKIYSWKNDIDEKIREQIIKLAELTPVGVRLFEPHKPLRLAKTGLLAAQKNANTNSTEIPDYIPKVLPDYIILGVPKSATTWLHKILMNHPEIDVVEGKEPEFFGDPGFSRGWKWYENLFSSMSGEQPKGEVSVGYFSDVDAPMRVSQLPNSGKLKFIVCLREPLSRALSHYNYRLMSGMAPASFEEAIKIPYFKDLLINEGFYATHFKQWLKFFNLEQFLFLTYDEIASKPESIVKKIEKFLEVDTFDIEIIKSQNTGVAIRFPKVYRSLLRLSYIVSSYQQISPFTQISRTLLTGIASKLTYKASGNTISLTEAQKNQYKLLFQKEIQEFMSLTNMELSHWLKA